MKANRVFSLGGQLRAAAGGELPPALEQAVMRGLSIAEMRSLAPLPDEAQRQVDTAVVRVGRDRLTVAADLMAENLVYNVDDPLSVLEVYWEAISETGGAKRAMNPEARVEEQLQDRTGYRVPLFITMDGFRLGSRILRASQRAMQPIDTSQVEQCTRRVNEGVEDQAINGATNVQVAGNTVPGILTAPNANNVAYVSNEAWTDSGHSGEDILVDVDAMIAAAEADKRYGPFNLYVNTAYHRKLSTNDFKANSDKTILQRLEEIQAGGRNLRVRVADQMPANRTALVQMTSDVIDLVNGQQPIAVPWTSASGFSFHWLVMAIAVVRVKTDYESRSGIVLGNLNLP